jgi:hypothetical protein
MKRNIRERSRFRGSPTISKASSVRCWPQLCAFISFRNLFAGAVIGFLISAALVVSVVLPRAETVKPRGIYDRATRGA